MNLLNKLRNPFVLAGQGFLMGGALFLANPQVVDPAPATSPQGSILATMTATR